MPNAEPRPARATLRGPVYDWVCQKDRPAKDRRDMDMSGAMPRRAWIEVRDEAGKLLGSFPSKIDGGTIITELPGFGEGARGTMTRFTEEVDGKVACMREEEEVEDLPSEPTIFSVQMG